MGCRVSALGALRRAYLRGPLWYHRSVLPPPDLPRATPRISLAIVIPALDEAPVIAQAVRRAREHADEVVVVDGGSRDDTARVAREAGAKLVTSAPGRGLQLNRGAAATRAEALLFLHADTLLPPSAGELVRRALAEGAVGGGFAVRFDHPRRLFPLGGRIVNLRTRLTGCPLGDQAQFVRRNVFERLGGFPAWQILEDLDFARRLKRAGRTVLIGAPVVTAARRFLNQGVVRTIATNWLIWLLFFAGVSPARLARLYRHIR